MIYNFAIGVAIVLESDWDCLLVVILGFEES